MLRVAAESYDDAKDCPLRNVMDIMGDKWSFLIFAVLEEGPCRFNQMKRLIGDISQRVLTTKLRDLERDGYVLRTVHPVSPPKVEYALTPLGREMLEPVRAMLDWAVASYPRIQRARKDFDRVTEKA